MGVQFPGPPAVPIHPDPMQQGRPRRDPANRLNLEAGMRVLVVDPDPHELVQEAVQWVGSEGQVAVVTGRQETADRLEAEWQQAGATQVSVHVAHPGDLPFPDDSLDRAVVVRVLGTAGDRQRVLLELSRVLKPGGLLGVEQRVIDRGSAGPRTVRQWCAAAGFERIEQYGNPLHYMLIFWRKPGEQPARQGDP